MKYNWSLHFSYFSKFLAISYAGILSTKKWFITELESKSAGGMNYKVY